MTVSRLHSVLCLALLTATMAGCSSCAGSFERRATRVRIFLDVDRPAIYELGPEGEPGDAIGQLERKAGDTLWCTGIWHQAAIGNVYYLVEDSGREVFIMRDNALNEDDRLRVRLGTTFRLPPLYAHAAWERAKKYFASDTTTPLEIATDNLLKTKASNDSNSIAYTVTRVEIEDQTNFQIEHQIICTSPRKKFNGTYAASLLAFYMYTGRYYVYER